MAPCRLFSRTRRNDGPLIPDNSYRPYQDNDDNESGDGTCRQDPPPDTAERAPRDQLTGALDKMAGLSRPASADKHKSCRVIWGVSRRDTT